MDALFDQSQCMICSHNIRKSRCVICGHPASTIFICNTLLIVRYIHIPKCNGSADLNNNNFCLLIDSPMRRSKSVCLCVAERQEQIWGLQQMQRKAREKRTGSESENRSCQTNPEWLTFRASSDFVTLIDRPPITSKGFAKSMNSLRWWLNCFAPISIQTRPESNYWMVPSFRLAKLT